MNEYYTLVLLIILVAVLGGLMIYMSLPNMCGSVLYCQYGNISMSNCWDSYLNANITDWRSHNDRFVDCSRVFEQ